MTTPPVRTPEERAASLVTARKNRTARAEIKRNLKAGDLDISALLDVGQRGTGDPIIGRMEIGQVLRAVPAWGPVKAMRLLSALNVDPARHVDTLSADVLGRILTAIDGG